ncbi:MAG: hypothetical protein JWR01_1104 [Subtercola sp.]|nr:hypothetical protein [Subtercola sp.]
MELRVAALRVLVRGAVAGLLATGVMSAVFSAAETFGMLGRKPPRIIVDHFLPSLGKKTADRVALASHLAYGAAGGVVYAALPVRSDSSPAARARRGLVYGLLVWAASYEGWLPLMGILPAAHRDRRRRAFAIIAAHVVYGVSLGLLSTQAHEGAK